MRSGGTWQREEAGMPITVKTFATLGEAASALQSDRGARFLAGGPLVMGATKPVLVPDISSRKVEIRYSFTGAQLLLFGAILYPRGRAPERAADQ